MKKILYNTGKPKKSCFAESFNINELLKMKISCKIIKSIYKSEDENGVVTYGLAFYRSGADKPIRIIKNIFTSKEQINILNNLINSNDLDEIHIDDIIDDVVDESFDYFYLNTNMNVG